MPKLPRRGFKWQGAQAWSSAWQCALLLVVAPSRVRKESEQRGRQFQCRVRPASQEASSPLRVAQSDRGCSPPASAALRAHTPSVPVQRCAVLGTGLARAADVVRAPLADTDRYAGPGRRAAAANDGAIGM
jgi:hypothetical protein